VENNNSIQRNKGDEIEILPSKAVVSFLREKKHLFCFVLMEGEKLVKCRMGEWIEFF
jgi:hypothetical protein